MARDSLGRFIRATAARHSATEVHINYGDRKPLTADEIEAALAKTGLVDLQHALRPLGASGTRRTVEHSTPERLPAEATPAAAYDVTGPARILLDIEHQVPGAITYIGQPFEWTFIKIAIDLIGFTFGVTLCALWFFVVFVNANYWIPKIVAWLK